MFARKTTRPLPMHPYFQLQQQQEPKSPRVALTVVITLLSAFIFGMVEIGNAFFTQHLVKTAAVEGVRFGIAESTARPGDRQVEEYVRSYLAEGGLDGNSASIFVTGAAGARGGKLIIDIAYPTRLLVMSLLIDWTPAVNTATAATDESDGEISRADTIILHGRAMGLFE